MALATIQFNNNPKGIFYSNEEISGCLILDLEKTLQVKKIYVRIKGKGIVSWKENGGDFWYRSSERYIDVNHDIYNEDFLLNLTAGQHCFNFSYLLPAHLPATFATTSGRVYYSCEVIVEGVHIVPMFTLKKHMAKKSFTIIPTIPFDSLSNANVMITKHSSKVLYTCCWSVGPLKVTLRVNRGAFVPGEKININVEIFNQSMMYLTNLEANLKRTVACKARACSKRDENLVISGARCLYTISPQESFVWKNGQIPIPSTPPTDLGGCQIISVTYHLKVKIGTQSTDCLSSGIAFKVPIVIGSLTAELANLMAIREQQHDQIISSQPLMLQNNLRCVNSLV